MTDQEQKEIDGVLKILGKEDPSFIAPDIEARFAAVKPGKQNIIVEAGAGTGKTKLLSCRICHLLLSKELKIDEIVAITFTEKAAAEIKQSVMNILRVILLILTSGEQTDLIKDGVKYLEQIFGKEKETLIKLIEQNFELIERSQISTIHSFAFQILKTYPLQANLAPGLEIDTGFIGDYIFNKNWATFLEEELSLQSPHRSLWEKLLEESNLDDLKSFAKMLREPYFDYCSFGSSPEEIQTFLALKISHMKNLLSSNMQPGKKRKLETQIEEAISRIENLSKNLATLSKKELLDLPAQEEIVFTKPSKAPVGWESEGDLETVKKFIEFANKFTPANLDLLEKTYNLFYSFAQRNKKEMLKQNVVSYNQSIVFARDLVQNNLSVRAELKKRYKSIMIDEFQDTDVAQGQLLLFLSEDENSSAKNWQDIILEPGKLFVVGDPKQSIYRFRGANISAYQKFLDLMISQQAQVCYLTTNFRSQGKIIDFVNKWGELAIQEQNLIQPRYIKLKKGKKQDSEKVEFFLINSQEKVNIDNLRANEANIVASWIQDNVGKKKFDDGTILSYKDITILYPVSGSIDIYTDALTRFNIPYNLESSGNFYEAQEIIDVLNILKVIYDPQDKLALIGVLRSPLCAMKDEEIIDLWQQKALSIFAKDFSASSAVKDTYKLLRDFHFKAGHLTLKELLNELFYKTDFVILESLACASEQILANLNKFLRIAFERASKGFTLGQLLLYIQAADNKTVQKEGQSSLIEENFDIVNVMTIHKSKGLSAKVIILVDSFYGKTNKSEMKYIDDFEGKAGISLKSLKNLNYFILQEKEILHKKAEQERLLYVALTRAEKKLFIGASSQKTNGKIENSLRNCSCYPSENNLENDLFSSIVFEYKDPQSFLKQKKNLILKENADWSGFIKSWEKNKAEFENYKKEEIVAPSHLKGDKTKIQESLDIGSLIHKTLNNYFQTGSFDLPLVMKVLDLENTNLIPSCQDILNNFEKGEVLKELKKMQFLGSEIPFSMYENGALVNGIIDALFKDKKGQLFIVDFKTDKIDSREIATYSLKYAGQLALYKRAVEKMFKTDSVKTCLVYLRLDKIFEL